MSRQDIAEALAAIRLFRGADSAFFDRIAQQPRARTAAKPDEMIYEAGDPADAVFIPFPREGTTAAPRGIVELSLPTSDAGSQSHLEHIVAGDVFGEFEFVAAGLGAGKAIRRSAARVIVPSDLYRVPFALLAPLLAEAEAIRARLIKLSFDRLMSALNVKSSQLLGDRDVALANWLLDAADNLGIAEGRHVQFSRTIGQREIADALGVTRETISLRLNEWERSGLINTGGQSQRLEILDYPRISLRAAVQKDAPQAAIDAAIAELDADLARGDLVRARNIGLDMLMFFPSSPELRHRVALANIRAGNLRDALAGLAYGGFATGSDIPLLRERVRAGLRSPAATPERLFFGKSGDDIDDIEWDDEREFERRVPVLVEDIAAIEARAQKELAFASVDANVRLKHAAASAEYYGNIHGAVGGTYAGINAAMMRRVAGEVGAASETVARVIRQVGTEPKGYWPSATLGEARLLAGDIGGALKALALAHRQADATDGHRSSTRLQIGRIGTELGLDVEALLSALPVGATAVYSGPLFRGAELDDEKQMALEAAIKTPIAAALSSGNIRYVYGALACGADIVVAEEALEQGAELHVVLPFPVDAFFETSVALGNPPDVTARWTERFWQCLRKSSSLTTLVDRPPETRQLDPYYFHAFRLAAGLALMRTEALSSPEPTMIAVDDGRPASGMAGAHAAVAGWRARGLPLITIPVTIEREPPRPSPEQTDTFRPVVFLWPVNEAVNVSTIVKNALAATGSKHAVLPRASRDRRQGVAIVADSISESIELLRAIAPLAAAAKHPVRVIADFGPAVDSKGHPADGAVSRLSGASDLVGLPAGIAIATRTFASRARAEPGMDARFIPIGRTAPAGHEGDGRPLPSREVYAMQFIASVSADQDERGRS